jgi:protein-S-isoprenylcysteine O-methyltransferase Ste14
VAIEIKLIVFVAATLAIAGVSRKALLSAKAHGFYRFFAWEAILALVLLNLEHWFADPFSPAQIISWVCLLASIYLVVQGMLLLRRAGKPDGTRTDEALLGLEKTTTLVTSGIYQHIRHPLYSSLLFLTWGAFLKWPTWPALMLALAASAFLAATARVEEGENLRFFGEAYREYMRRSKMFIPYIF